MLFYQEFFKEVISSINTVELEKLDQMVDILYSLRERSGRLFIIGSGGGAGHASHAVCDFRKLCEIEAYAPYDNISELTARTNDEGYDTSITEWLKISKFCHNDCLFVFSVGGGHVNVSTNIVKALKLASKEMADIIGVTGNDGGQTKIFANVCLTIKTNEFITPITEGMQSIIWHLLVSHPKLQLKLTKW